MSGKTLSSTSGVVLPGELLEKNRVSGVGFSISLPEGWQVYRDTTGKARQVLFRKFGVPLELELADGTLATVQAEVDHPVEMAGKYERILYDESDLEAKQALFLYTELMRDGWDMGREERIETAGGEILVFVGEGRGANTGKTDGGRDRVLRRLILVFPKKDALHIFEFIGPSGVLPVETLTAFVRHGFSSRPSGRSSRSTSHGITFFENTSSFRFEGDIEGGLALSGRVGEYPCGLRVSSPEDPEGIRTVNALSQEEPSAHLYVEKQRTDLHVESRMYSQEICLVRARMPRQGEERVVEYLIELYIDSGGRLLEAEEVFSIDNIRYLFERELFFP